MSAKLPVLSDLLTNSRLKTARACARLHHLKYDLGYRPIWDGDDQRFGSIFHKGLEAWWKAWELAEDERLDAGLAAFADVSDPFERAKAEEMLRGYHYMWKDEPYEVVSVEQEFLGELRNPESGMPSRTWRLGGKLDVLVRDTRDGLVRLMEHKTSSEDISAGSEYWRRLRMDGQVSVYYEGARLLGHEVAACVYDVCGKPGLRPSNVPLVDDEGVKIVHDATGARVRTKDGKKWRQTGDTDLGYVLQTRPETPEEYRERLIEAIAENPTKFFQRGEVIRLEAEMHEAMLEVWQQGKTIRENQTAGRHLRNPDACRQFGHTCAFFDVCAGQASLDDTTRFTRLDDVHPELSGVAVGATPKEEALAP